MDTFIETQVMRWLELALEQPSNEHEAWLESQAIDGEIRARVLALLARADHANGFLDTPVFAKLSSNAMPVPGDRLGAWRLEREIDSGGMGVVFQANRADGAYELQTAVKLIRGVDQTHHAELVARFENERRLLARLQHPNVVRILDGGSTSHGLPYLVMEYVDGHRLNEYCESKRLDVAARARLLALVCDGVQAAHQHLIVHRDLKPGNILVDNNGQPRVLDFGIARLLDDNRDSTLTRTGTSAMTPAYASPEQVRHEPLTTASDVYSLGVILYELLTGVRPHDLGGLSPAQVERIVCDTDPRPLRKALAASSLAEADKQLRLARIGSDLERIVARALHRDAERRYGSSQALGDDLRRYLDGLPVTAHPDSAGYRIGKFVRRHRLALGAAALATCAVLGASAVALWQAARAERSAADMTLINSFLVDMLSISNPHQSGSEITLAAALDNGANEVDKRFGDRPDLAVDIRYALAKSMLGRYRLDAAEKQLERTLQESTQVFGDDDPRSIRAIASLASLRKEQSRDAEASALYQDALDRMRRSEQTDTALYATVLNDFGVLYLIRNEFDKADTLLREAREVGARTTDRATTDEERAQTLANLAHAARGLDRLDEADALYRQAEAVFERIYPDGSPQLATVLNNRARLSRARGEPEKALGFLQRAVPMHRRSFTGDHVMVLVPTTNLARQAIELNRVDLAIEPAETAVAMSDRMYAASEHYYHAQALVTLAELRLMQQRESDADALLVRAQKSLDGLESPNAGSQEYLDRIRGRLCTSASSGRSPIACSPTAARVEAG